MNVIGTFRRATTRELNHIVWLDIRGVSKLIGKIQTHVGSNKREIYSCS